MLLFLRREAGGGAGPAVEALREGVPAAAVGAAAGAVNVAEDVAASLLEVLPRLNMGGEVVAGTVVMVEDAVSAEGLAPKAPNRLDVGLEVSVAADVEAAEDAPLISEPKRLELGAEEVALEVPAPKRFDIGADVAWVDKLAPNGVDADGALVVAIPKVGVAAA